MKTEAIQPAIKKVWELLAQVPDPEIPVLSVLDLGIVREVKVRDGSLEVVITPTYSGCPAMRTIEVNIRSVLQENGFPTAKITTTLSPAWTTDWMTEEAKAKLKAYGIAPPVGSSVDKSALLFPERIIACPQCGSQNTEMISQFGSTACKALFRCKDCLEPFDYFKCH